MIEVAKYKQAHDEILNRLKRGHYAIGMRIPSKYDMSDAFNVSRVTIRKALELLVRDGYLTSRQGSGYNVATLSPPSSTCLVSFTDKVLREGHGPGARLLRLENEAKDVPKPVSDMFGEPVSLVERLRTVDGTSVMITQLWIPKRLAPRLSAGDFPETGQNQSVLRVLQTVFDLGWNSACESLDSIIADRITSKTLGIPEGTPILSQACTAFDEDNGPVFFDQVYRKAPITFDLTASSPAPDVVRGCICP